jgi:hypothetical protein
MAASVHQRLLNHARKEAFDSTMCFSAMRWNVGYMSLEERSQRTVHSQGRADADRLGFAVTRPTRDIDMLARVQNDLGGIRRLIADLCRMPCEDDGSSLR